MRIELHRALEEALGRREVAAVVADDREHVEDVGVAVGELEHLAEHPLGAVVLPALVVLAPEDQELLEALIHRSCIPRAPPAWRLERPVGEPSVHDGGPFGLPRATALGTP